MVRGTAGHQDGRKHFWACHMAVGSEHRAHPRILQDGDMASGSNAHRTEASSRRSRHIEHLAASTVGSSESSYHTCTPSPSGMDTWGMTTRRHDRRAALVDGHTLSAGRTGIDKVEALCHKVEEAVGRSDHNGS